MTEREVQTGFPVPAGSQTAVLEAEAVSPYLHDRGSLVYNPTTGESFALWTLGTLSTWCDRCRRSSVSRNRR